MSKRLARLLIRNYRIKKVNSDKFTLLKEYDNGEHFVLIEHEAD